MAAGAADDLDARLIAAHGRGDGETLVVLYREAADAAEAQGDIDRAFFYLVHAYVFALETGHGDAESIRRRLKSGGREL